MLDKVILVHYIHIGNTSTQRSREVLAKYIETYRNTPADADKIINYWVPIREGESRIECIYPVPGVQPEMLNSFIEKVDRLMSAVDLKLQDGDVSNVFRDIDWKGYISDNMEPQHSPEAVRAALSTALSSFINHANTAATRWEISKAVETVLLAFGVKFTDVYIEEGNGRDVSSVNVKIMNGGTEVTFG